MAAGAKAVKFSIVVVCLNAGNKLRTTVESILKQSCGDYEIIVKDGMSSDGCLDKLPEDGRIKIFAEKDSGIYDGMNQAADKAAGEYVYFLNCGDVFYDEEVLRRVKEEIEKRRSRDAGEIEEERNGKKYIFYGDIYERLTEERVASNPAMDAFGCYRNVPCHQACFYGMGLMREKKFDVEYRVRADYEHFLWCFFKGKAETVYMPLLIADYEGGGFSETKENRRVSAAEHKEIVGKYMPFGLVLKYRAIMVLTLSGVRTWLARNRVTARVYNGVKRWVYERRGK